MLAPDSPDFDPMSPKYMSDNELEDEWMQLKVDAIELQQDFASEIETPSTNQSRLAELEDERNRRRATKSQQYPDNSTVVQPLAATNISTEPERRGLLLTTQPLMTWPDGYWTELINSHNWSASVRESLELLNEFISTSIRAVPLETNTSKFPSSDTIGAPRITIEAVFFVFLLKSVSELNSSDEKGPETKYALPRRIARRFGLSLYQLEDLLRQSLLSSEDDSIPPARPDSSVQMRLAEAIQLAAIYAGPPSLTNQKAISKNGAIDFRHLIAAFLQFPDQHHEGYFGRETHIHGLHNKIVIEEFRKYIQTSDDVKRDDLPGLWTRLYPYSKDQTDSENGDNPSEPFYKVTEGSYFRQLDTEEQEEFDVYLRDQRLKLSYSCGTSIRLAWEATAAIIHNRRDCHVSPEMLYLGFLAVGMDDRQKDYRKASLPAALGFAIQVDESQLAELFEKYRQESPESERSKATPMPSFTHLWEEARRVQRDCSERSVISARHLLAAMMLRYQQDSQCRNALDNYGFSRDIALDCLIDNLQLYQEEDNASAWKSVIARIKSQYVRPSDIGTGRNLSRFATKAEICLDADKYASVLAELLRYPSDEEFSLALYGHWGRGKTFLMEKTRDIINHLPTPDLSDSIEKGEYETVFFSAWRYPSRPEVWIHLYETVFQHLRSKGWWSSLPHIIRSGIIRHGQLTLWCLWIGLVWTAMPKVWLVKLLGSSVLGIHAPGLQLNPFVYLTAITEWGVAALTGIFGYLFITKLWDTTKVLQKSFLSGTRHTEKLGLQATVGSDLSALLMGWINVAKPKGNGWVQLAIACLTLIGLVWWRVWHSPIIAVLFTVPIGGFWFVMKRAFSSASPSPRRLLLVVDDLDRCQIDHLLSVVESVKLLIEDKEVSSRVRVVVLVEEDILKHAIWSKYGHLASETTAKLLDTHYNPERLVRENCEKMFTAHLRLRKLTSREIETIVAQFATSESNTPAEILADGAAKSDTVATKSAAPVSTSYDGIVAPSQPLDTTTVAPPQPVKSATDVVKMVTSLQNDGTETTPTHSTDETQIHTEQEVFKQDEHSAIVSALRDVGHRLKDGIGPRSARAFLFRYQLAKILLEKLAVPNWTVSELCDLLLFRMFENSDPSQAPSASSARIQEIVDEVS